MRSVLRVNPLKGDFEAKLTGAPQAFELAATANKLWDTTDAKKALTDTGRVPEHSGESDLQLELNAAAQSTDEFAEVTVNIGAIGNIYRGAHLAILGYTEKIALEGFLFKGGQPYHDRLGDFTLLASGLRPYVRET